jgi:hypothetical protein
LAEFDNIYNIKEMRKIDYWMYLEKQNIILSNILIMFLIIFVYSCQKNDKSGYMDDTVIEQLLSENAIKNIKEYENINAIVNIDINGIELLNTDFEIINHNKIIYYFEVSNLNEGIIDFYKGGIEIELVIKIKNSELVYKLNEIIDPIIHLTINDIKYLTKGLRAKDFQEYMNDVFIFVLDENKKMIIENNVISFISYYDR